jgi:NACalpha-BTF3-like transcription factor
MSKEEDKTQQKAAEAEAEHHAGSDEEEEPQQETVKSKKDENSAMDKLTDVVEEKAMDENKMKEAFQALRKQEEADKEAERLLEKKLAAVKVSKDDVALVAQEMELTTQQADRKLREADGDVVKCLQTLIAA